jgi:hypothetical protein
MQRLDAGCVRLDLDQLLRTDEPDPWDAVGDSPPEQLSQPRALGVSHSDHDLAAPFIRNAVLDSQAFKRRPALEAEPRFKGPWRVVQASVKYS